MKKPTRVEKKLRRRRRFLKIILFLLIISMFVLTLLKASIFNINNINIVGNNKLTYEMIENSSNIYIGDNIFRMRPDLAEEGIKRLTYIKDVKVNRKLPNTIVINVNERREIFVAKYISSYFLIDDEGIILDIKDTNLDNMPVVTGLNIKDLRIGQNIFKNDLSKEFVELIDKSNKLDLLPNMGVIEVVDEEEISFTLNNGIYIAFGTLDNVEYRLRLLDEVLKDVEKKGINCRMIIMNKGDNPILVTED